MLEILILLMIGVLTARRAPGQVRSLSMKFAAFKEATLASVTGRELPMVPIRSDNDIYTVRDVIDQMAGAKADGIFLISPETRTTPNLQRIARSGAQNLSASLLRRGLARGDKIAFMMNNGLEAATLFWALFTPAVSSCR